MSAPAPLEGQTRVRRRGAVIVPNETVYDASLSYNALGLLAVLLARPEDAPQGYRTLMRPGVGQRAILAGFKELREGGYRYQFLRRVAGPSGRPTLVTDTYVVDSPISLEQARQWHFEATGEVAVERGEAAAKRAAGEAAAEAGTPSHEDASKATLASVCDAHNCDAHSCDAHSCVAQEKALTGLEKNTQDKSINGAAPENSEAPLELVECNVCHHYARAHNINDAGVCTGCSAAAAREPQPEAELGQGREQVRAMLAAKRAMRGREAIARATSKDALDGREINE
jgi:hypothetical protein